MAAAENRRRKKERKSKQDISPWGSLVQQRPAGDETPPPDYDPSADYDTAEEPSHRVWRDMWHRFSIWSLMATLLFIVFTGGLIILTLKMWTPQDMRDIAGYTDKGTARDLLVALRNANGGELIFTEGEINRYLRDTCRLRQTGIFSVIAHAQGAAVRMHDGYAELIIDRVLSTHFHQTTSIFLRFEREMDHGRPKLRVEFRGEHSDSLLQGGRIGCVGVPQRFMQILRPALDTMQDCYPDILDIIDSIGYRPEFHRGHNGQEGYVRLIPYTPPTSSS